MICLRGVLRQRLEAVGWPPPVTVGLGASPSSRNSSEEEWQGFTQADPQACSLCPPYVFAQLQNYCGYLNVNNFFVVHWFKVDIVLFLWQALDDVNRIAAAFIALQRSVQRSSFEAVSPLTPMHTRTCTHRKRSPCADMHACTGHPNFCRELRPLR